MKQPEHYILNATLFKHQLIQLDNCESLPNIAALQMNKDITVKIQNGEMVKVFQNCHIDNTDNRRLRLPLEVMVWLKNEFPFSAAYFTDKDAESIWKKADKKIFFKQLQSTSPKLHTPAETLLLSWVPEAEPYLYLQTGFKITIENAAKVLSTEAMSKVLPYIFSSVQNTSYIEPKSNGKKCYAIDYTTPWLSASEYANTAFSHPGIYFLRRKQEGQYSYYVGKAADIKNRIVRKENVLFHPNEKGEDNKQYDEICCVAINLDDILCTYEILDEYTRTPKNNPGVSGGSKVDSVLYAVEDIAIHSISMILQGEGKKLDNHQYRTYTSEALEGRTIE